MIKTLTLHNNDTTLRHNGVENVLILTSYIPLDI
jgi:hypothetical protein